MNLDLKQIKKIFFIGIGGIGISALAKMVHSKGMEVSGVNDEEGKTIDSLKELDVQIIFQKDFRDLPEVDMYVYSDAWIYRDPDILKKVRATGKPVFSYFEALGIFAKDYKVIAIAGTHGKTTTTAMVADILIDAGLDPTVIVGSFVKKFDNNFRKGNGEYLVVEADEYNRHFLNFHPHLSVVTNIEADHLDYYKDINDIKNAFNQLKLQSENVISDYSKYLKEVPKLSVLGEHNRQNAAAAFAVAELLGVDEEIIKKSLANFAGTWRRLEKIGETSTGAIVYDDYAHHPTEIKASLQALRELYGNKHITVVFQPHLYSRTKALFDDFTKGFDGADRVMLLPIYFAREDKDESVSSEKLAEAINLTHLTPDPSPYKGEGKDLFAQAFPDFESAERGVLGLDLGSNDVFVTMGAGVAYKITEKALTLVQGISTPQN